MKFRVIKGCWETTADPLYFVIKERGKEKSEVVTWFCNKAEADKLAAKLNKENGNG